MDYKYIGFGSTYVRSISGTIGRIHCAHALDELEYYNIVQYLDSNGSYGVIAKCADEYASEWIRDTIIRHTEDDYCGEETRV